MEPEAGVKWKEDRTREEDERTMIDQAPCPRCRHANPPQNRFCGSCGASLEASSDLVVRWENGLTMMGRTLPAKLGPAGNVLVVGLATLAAQAGLSWLHQKIKAEGPPLTLTAREHNAAVSEGLLGRSLEEVLIQELQESYRSRTFAWQAIRSIVVTERTSSKRRSAGRPWEAWSSGSSRASSSLVEPKR
jgi:hypothetical protein